MHNPEMILPPISRPDSGTVSGFSSTADFLCSRSTKRRQGAKKKQRDNKGEDSEKQNGAN